MLRVLLMVGILTLAEQAKLAEEAIASGDAQAIEIVDRLLAHPLFAFQPRPDKPEEFDEQTGFVEDNESRFSVLLGGTGAGKTEAAAYKTARFLLETRPPRPRTPFWILGETYELVCGVCWDEKLANYIPADQIEHTDWYKPNRKWPFAVSLKPWPDGTSWVIEFKAYSQGVQRLQARSIGGYWFNEAAPLALVEEVQGRCRDYDSPGWADFTPVHAVDALWPARYDDPPEGWAFYHVNNLKNDALAEGWAERFLDGVPPDMRDTRQIGKFTAHRGQVYKEWRRTLHICEPNEVPKGHRKLRGIDFGFANPFCCLWATVDREGRYWIYREHYAEGLLNKRHAEIIKAADPWDSPLCGPTYSDHDAQQRAEFNAAGIACTPARKDILPGIEFLRSLMMRTGTGGKPLLQVSRECVNLIRELPNIRWPTGAGSAHRIGSQRNPAELPVDFDNHAADTLRYICFTDNTHRGGTAPQSIKREWEPKKSLRFEKARR